MIYPELNSAPIKCAKRKCSFKGYESDLVSKNTVENKPGTIVMTQKVCPYCGHGSYYFMTDKEIKAWQK